MAMSAPAVKPRNTIMIRRCVMMALNCWSVMPAPPFAFVALLVLPSLAMGQAAAISDQQVIERIIQQSRQEYYATGRPCACPYDLARNGSSCGARSAYSRPGGAEPKC